MRDLKSLGLIIFRTLAFLSLTIAKIAIGPVAVSMAAVSRWCHVDLKLISTLTVPYKSLGRME
jgi:hypothetical protein